ncbi:hypothetical protein [Thiothrix eikelboomii]|uniref:Uncharacterized protein n=1 Tax=Thiothrix eikelboomii TaxID=92487 RepID=A0A1T4X0A8_9GAMM|nr:hypothetical protein [Thiothrix eikelboomii]SKA83083.1 hypothetical protein SAMN02745130_02354 [Thiothrix eikelboomii]
MFRTIVFISAFALLVYSLTMVFKYWDFVELAPDIAALMNENVKLTDLEAQIEQSIAKDNPDEARLYLSLAQTFGYPVMAAQFLPRIEALETPWQVTRRQAEQFANGFMEGTGETGAGVAGAVTADFTVIGDARDLYEQYQNLQTGKEVNELITALAAVGVGLTAITVLSSGSAAPLKTGSSTLKMATRANKLSPTLQAVLIKQATDVLDYKAVLLAARGEKNLDKLRQAAVKAYNPKALDALSETANQVNSIRKSTSLVDTLEILRYADSADDLRRLEKLSVKYGTETKGILKLLGKTAIGTVRVLRHATELAIAALASVVSLLASLFALSAYLRPKAA